jgi:hypothetical protein
MDYSAATAPLSFGKTLFALPHLLIGAGFLVASFMRKVRWYFGIAGSVFVVTVALVLINDASLAIQCHRAARDGEGTVVSGIVSSIERTYSRSGQATVSFVVGAERVSTRVSGINQDCGFLQSVGRTFRPTEGQALELLLFNGHIVRLRVTQ